MSVDVVAGHHHVFEPGPSRDARTLLLLHGTGGDEFDLLQVGRTLAPDANLLSPRGRVLENGMPRWFRRLREGVLDVEDLKARAGELAEFVREATREYGLDPARVIAVGYSNGANVAAGLLLTHPRVLSGAVLARAMVPFEPGAGEPPQPTRAHVLLLPGRHDPYSRSPTTERLADILRAAGARVDLEWVQAGHELTPSDVAAAKWWLQAAPEASA